jgi:hypothetical protein
MKSMKLEGVEVVAARRHVAIRFAPLHVLASVVDCASPLSSRKRSLARIYTATKMMDEANETPAFARVQETYNKLWRQYQHQLDRITPFILQRWLGTAGLVSVFALRIVFAQGVSALCQALDMHRLTSRPCVVVYWYVSHS